MSSIEKTVQYTAEDLQWAYSVHYKKKYPMRSKLMLITALISIAVGVALVVVSVAFPHSQVSSWVSWFFLCYGLMILVMYYMNFKNIGKRLYQRSPDFQKPFHYIISETRLEVKTENFNNNNEWNHFTSAMLVSDVLLLYVNKYRFNFLLKKHFTDEEFKQITAWISQNTTLTTL